MISLMFPGQGAQSPRMLEGVSRCGQFRARYQAVCDEIGLDVVREIARTGTDLLNLNLVSSLLTVLVSALSLDLFLERNALAPQFVAGYSVGQWSALYAAGMITYEQLIRVVATRARLMDGCMKGRDGGMCAVFGVDEAALVGLLAEIRDGGDPIFVGNFNCRGQYSITGTERALRLAQERLGALKPKKVVRVPVSGPWHCNLLADAESELTAYLRTIEFRCRSVPIVDNVTGKWLPVDDKALRTNLVRHVSHPVYWELGVRTLIASGCTQFVEIGYGCMLTRFGWFIDRRASFSAFHS